MYQICQLYVPAFYRSYGKKAVSKITKLLPCLKKAGFAGIYLIALWEDGGYDNGFDVVRYSVNPKFGTNRGLKNLIKMAHKLGLLVGVDVVPNHVSDKNILAQNCLKDVPGYEDALYVVSETEAKKLTEAGVISVNGELAYSDFGDKYVRTTFCDHHQLNLNWNNQKVQEYFANVFKHFIKIGVDFARVDCGQLLLEDVTRADKGNILACFNPKESVNAVHKVSSGMTLFFEWLDPASADIFDDLPGCYALDCSYVVTGRQNLDWSGCDKLIPLVGGHDQMTLADRGIKFEDIIEHMSEKKYVFLDMQTLIGWKTDPDILPGDEDYDADVGHQSMFANQRYRARRPIGGVMAEFLRLFRN